MEKQAKRKWWVLGALAISLLAVGLDLTVLNLALPTLATELNASNSELQWFADAYNLVLAAAMLPVGLLGDRFGRKKLLLIGLLLFGGASLLCAYAGSGGALIAGRAVLGLGAAILTPLTVSIIPVLFTEAERPKAISLWAMASALGIPLGPILGGWLLNHYWWGSVFLINIPVILIGLIAVATLMPESRSERKPRADLVGILLSSVGLVGLTYGFIEAGERGWGDARPLLLIAVGLAMLIGFVSWERRTRHPMADLTLFRSRSFTWGSLLATVVSFLMFGLLFVMPQYFQGVEGADAFGTGLRLLPLLGGLMAAAKGGERLKPMLGNRIIIAFGFVLMTAALAAGATTDTASSYGWAATWLAVAGLGLGFTLPSAMEEATGALSAERSGVGSALIMAMRQVGGAIGVAVLGTVLNDGYRAKLEGASLPAEAVGEARRSVASGAAAALRIDSEALLHSVRTAFVHGMDVMLWVCVGLAALAIVLTLVFLPRRILTKGASSVSE